ncbi:MAG: sporulation protein YjcZ [Bacilli bacterium]|nr:sporulation protein YjcZ [Bacilli bacterium]
MYYYGGYQGYGCSNCGYQNYGGCGSGYGAAIVLVLFILLVIIIGTRSWNN